jgi:hypothetical protein
VTRLFECTQELLVSCGINWKLLTTHFLKCHTRLVEQKLLTKLRQIDPMILHIDSHLRALCVVAVCLVSASGIRAPFHLVASRNFSIAEQFNDGESVTSRFDSDHSPAWIH